MALKVKTAGAYADAAGVSVKKNGVYSTASVWVKAGGVYGAESGVPVLGMVFSGDSISNGYQQTTSTPAQWGIQTGKPYTITAENGKTLVHCDSEYATDEAPVYNETNRNYLVLQAGTNDIPALPTLGTLTGAVTSYVSKAKATGYSVCIGTVFPRGDYWTGTAADDLRLAFNAWIRANASALGYRLIDYAAIPQMYDPMNLYWYNADMVHITDAASWVIANYLRQQLGLAYVATDTTPTGFTFTDITNADVSTVYTSNEIQVLGTSAPAAISITGGTYSVNGGAYTSSSGTVNPYDKIKVRQTSSSSLSTAANAVLTIGGVSDTYTVTTNSGVVTTVFVNPPQSGTFTYSNGDKTILNTVPDGLAITTNPISAKKVFACTLDAQVTSQFSNIGIRNGTANGANGFDTNGFAFYSNGQWFYNGASVAPTGQAFGPGDTIGVIVDPAGMIWITKNGTDFYGSTTPLTAAQVAAGTGGQSFSVSGTLYGAAGNLTNAGHQWTILTAWPVGWTMPSGYTLL